MPNSVSKQDWENFRAIGRVPKSARTEIVESWKRSSGVLATGLTRAPLADEAQLQRARAQAGRFMRAARPASQNAGYLLNRSGNMILLCDSQGMVIDQVGDPATLEMGRENHLHSGGRWLEEDIGTNAIGMALRTGMPTQVFRTEHFSEEIQRWSCSATPVRDPVTDHILGVIDVSWPAEALRSDSAALSAMLAMQAETMLRQLLLTEREKLTEIASLRRLRRGNTPLAVLDRYGLGVLSTDNAQQLIDDEAAFQQLRETLPQLLDQPEEQLVSSIQTLLPGVDLELVRDGDNRIGILLSKRQSRPTTTQNPLNLETMARVGQVLAQICSQAARLAPMQLPVLIEGETGAGKATLAEAIHHAGSMPDRPFVRLDCSLLTAEGLRRDLADGLVERLSQAGGTLHLKSPAGCPPDAQKLLLNLVEQAAQAGMRLVTTSTRCLSDEMRAGRFRGDLYFRIAVARLDLVPLRDRRDEILPHLRAIVRQKTAPGRNLNFTNSALTAFTAYDWPGNLREMTNLVEMLLAVASNGLIDHRSLPPEFRRPPARHGDTLRDAERAQILAAIEQSQGNMTQVARRLGIARSTLYLKLDALRIERPSRR
ncbi:sigma-54-dependent Fis family transcriptional regulator [Paracoccus methylovorus]|uniref:Sigma-54-dependent Fis family transcriptional regulator n=1 Tax=Paracoccus methylovorus TaxID=2812658 RepID=A0ABX7JMK8_9RHOB|nr:MULTISPECIES: sigma 54-interacting transcriptional regulator [Paracoccus]QRZ15215.1 sigma-54-dependent Fis family transcriptional regulator [Paracoccus methylovorus]